MKTRTLCVPLFAMALLGAGCGNRDRVEGIEYPLDQSFTTKVPVDPGILHNEILEEMNAASIPAGSLKRMQYLTRFVTAANRVFARYGASRDLTLNDCRFILDVGAAIQPLYDFRLKDPTRADPVAVLVYWHDQGLLNDQELTQLQEVFGAAVGEDAMAAATAVASQPASEVVANGVSVYQASLEYWGEHAAPPLRWPGERPLRGRDDEIRKTIADGLGGIIGGLLGGVIGGGLVGTGLSLLFMIEQECWPTPCHGDGPPPGPSPCPPHRGYGPPADC